MPKKGVSEVKNGNKSKQIVEDDILNEVVADVCFATKDKKRQKFALYYLLGLSVRQAALKAGYSEQYANSGIYKYIGEGSRFRKEIEAIVSKIPERYRQICQARLVTVSEIEGKVLEEQLRDPVKAMQHPQVLKQVKTTAGVLADDSPKPYRFNIEELNVIQQGLRLYLEAPAGPKPKAKVVDYEPVKS